MKLLFINSYFITVSEKKIKLFLYLRIKIIIKFLFLLILIIKFNFYFYFFCHNCIDNNKNNQCMKCPVSIIFKGLKILSVEETLNEIIFNNKSISRFGDGEFNLLFGESIGFQDVNNMLVEKLLIVLNSNESGLLIGLNINYNKESLEKFTDDAKKYFIQWTEKFKLKLIKLINKNKIYYSSMITRFYMDYKDKTHVHQYIQKLKKIWDNRDIVIIEGEKSRVGVGNNLFNNTKSIKRIICPSENAFGTYNQIFFEASKIDKRNLVLIALGPTATVLAHDLYKIGYQAIDIGHVDIEYEWFLRNKTKKCQIENKYVNEVEEKNFNFTTINDQNYYNQIITKIINN